MPNATENPRIDALTSELHRLRDSHHQSDDHLHALLLKVTEIQLNLATQDKTLNKLDASLNGNGRPGLLTRMDRLEQITSTLCRAAWLLTAAATTAAVRWAASKF